MSQRDALFNNQIFRKDVPIILACRRDLAAFMGVRVVYDSTGYQPGNCLVRYNSGANAGLFAKWSAASGGSYDSPVVLFDPCSASDQLANNAGVTTAVSGSSLLAAIFSAAAVYTNLLIDYDANFKALIKSIDRVDSGSNQLTSF